MIRGRTILRLLRIILGCVCLLIGVLLGPLPIVQGWVFVLMGLGILAREVPWVRRFLRRVRDLPGVRRILRPLHARLIVTRRRLRRRMAARRAKGAARS